MAQDQKTGLNLKLPYRVILTNRATKSFERLSQETKQRVSEALNVLGLTPVPFKLFDVNKLKGFRNTYRIRIGDWRVIYEYRAESRIIVVHDILRREKAYR